MSKLEINIDSTSLGSSACMQNFYWTVIGSIEDGKIVGGYRSLPNASMVYGVAVHKFIDVMYKTGGHFPTARAAAEKTLLGIKKDPNDSRHFLYDTRHLITTCYNLWTSYIEAELNYEVLIVPSKCYWCDGTGVVQSTSTEQMCPCDCDHCKGKGIVDGPATELTFKIPIYEDDFCIIHLCGTIDTVGQFKGGCFAIRDWKTTGSWKKDEYLSSYELSRQLRIYTLACKLEARNNPDSILGRIGATSMGAFIDAIFLKAKPNEVEFRRGDVFTYSQNDLDNFEISLQRFCTRLSHDIQNNTVQKEGILNGSCDAKWGKCRFWNACKSNDNVAQLLLKRDFTRKIYQPLNFNE